MSIGKYSSAAVLAILAPAADNDGQEALVGSTAPFTIYQSNGETWIPIGGALPTAPSTGGGVLAISDEGASLTTAATALNFTGAGVTATVGGGGAVTVTVPGASSGGASVAVQDEGAALTSAAALLNFVGPGVTATASGANVTVTVPGATATPGAPLYQIASAYTPTATPTSLGGTFGIKSVSRKFELLPPALLQVDVAPGSGDVGHFLAQGLVTNGGTYSATSNGKAWLFNSGGATNAVSSFQSGAGPRGAWWTAELTFDSAAPVTQTTSSANTVQIGIFAAGAKNISLLYDFTAKTFKYYVINTSVVASSAAFSSPSPNLLPLKISVTCTGTTLKGFCTFSDGSVYSIPGWDAVYDSATVFDFREQENLNGYRYGFLFNSNADQVFAVNRFRAGHAGGLGPRDINFVQLPDGSNLIREDKLYFTATNPGFCYTTGNQVYSTFAAGVWTLDILTQQIAHVGVIFVKSGTKVLNGADFQIVFFPTTNTYRLQFSNFKMGPGSGTFDSISTAYPTTDSNILSGVHVLANYSPVTLTGAQRYEADASFALKDGTTNDYRIGYSWRAAGDTSANIGFAIASTADFVTFTTVFSVAGGGFVNEGVKVVRIGGVQYFATTSINGSSINNIVIYDFNGNQVASFANPIPITGNPANHPSIFSYALEGKTHYGMLAMDGENYNDGSGAVYTGTYGNCYVLESSVTEVGYQTPIRKFAR